jgi:hypothetical protein
LNNSPIETPSSLASVECTSATDVAENSSSFSNLEMIALALRSMYYKWPITFYYHTRCSLPHFAVQLIRRSHYWLFKEIRTKIDYIFHYINAFLKESIVQIYHTTYFHQLNNMSHIFIIKCCIWVLLLKMRLSFYN